MKKIHKIMISILKLLFLSLTAQSSEHQGMSSYLVEDYLPSDRLTTNSLETEDKNINTIKPEIPEKNQVAFTTLGRQILQDILEHGSSSKVALPEFQNIPSEVKDTIAFHKDGENNTIAWARWALCNNDPDQQEYLAKIICLSWALHNISKEKGEDFSRGSFTLIDPDHRIYTFLLNYVIYVNDDQNPASLSWIKTTSNFAYRRDPDLRGSSHHRGQTEDSQFGIDIRFQSYETVYGYLPHTNRHLLFGKLNIPKSTHPLTFIKFEPVGIGSIGEAASHLFNYTQSGEVSEETRREKDIPEVIISKFESLTSMPWLKQQYKVHQMVNHTTFRLQPKALELFKETLKKHFPYDSEELYSIRTGNEVILDLRPFLSQTVE